MIQLIVDLLYCLIKLIIIEIHGYNLYQRVKEADVRIYHSSLGNKFGFQFYLAKMTS